MLLLVNAHLPHDLLMAPKHDISTEHMVPSQRNTEIVNAAQGNLNNIAEQTNQLLSIADLIELLCQAATTSAPATAYSSKTPPPDSTGNDAKEISSILRSKVLDFTKYPHKLAEDTWEIEVCSKERDAACPMYHFISMVLLTIF